ncbi:MAG: DUF6345 domain-containing protein [Candidatus Heimdallarchaeota archaeon]
MKIKHLPVILSFLFVLFLIPNQSNIVVSFDETVVVSDFNFEAVGEAQIFQTVPVDLNLTYVQSVASEFMTIGGTTSQTEDLIILSDGSKTFEMYTACGSIWYADESKLWNVSNGADLPEFASIKDIAGAFIAKSSYCITPQLTYYGSTNATAFDPVTEETQEKILNLNVNYGYELNGIKLGGPGATSSVSIGDGGEIIGFNWIYREVIPLHYELVISFEDALELHGLTYDESIEYELVYYAAEVGEVQNYIYPVYECEITQTLPGSDEEYTSIYSLSATPFDPKATITSPTNGKAFPAGDTIEFTSNIAGGNGPFTYQWESDIDGIIGTEEILSIDSLTVVTKDNTAGSHTIFLTITDANGLTASDAISVEIVGKTALFGIELLFIVGLIGSVFFIFVSQDKNRKRKSILIVTSLSLIFLIPSVLRISVVSAETTDIGSGILYVDNTDDSDNEVGAEYVNYSGKDYLKYSNDITRRFYNKIGDSSLWDKKFKYGGNNAWEQDFKYAAEGGTDSYYIDAVDLAFFSGHGTPYGVLFTSFVDDDYLTCYDAQWGDGDLEWIVLDACNCLQKTKDGNTVFARWDSAMKGVHMIFGFHTTSRDSPSRGEKFAKYLRDGHSMKWSWFKAARLTNNWKKYSAVFYGSLSDDTWNPQQDDCVRDHLTGYGYVSSDPINAKWLVWISSQC